MEEINICFGKLEKMEKMLKEKALKKQNEVKEQNIAIQKDV